MEFLDQLNSVLPAKYAGYLAILLQLCKWLPEFYSSVTKGGGLKRIFCNFIFGENIPKVIAQDYKQELDTKAPLGHNAEKLP